MFKVAILQKRAINAQIDKNIETIIMAMEEASENHADILLLPECFITGYDLPMSYEKSISDDDIRIAKICKYAKKYKIGVVLTSFTKGNKQPQNSAFVINKSGDILMKYSKVHTCDFADERNVESGKEFKVCDFEGIKLGIMICYDREFPESARILMLKGAEVILVPNDCGSMQPRIRALSTRAYENMVAVAMACLLYTSTLDQVKFLRDGGDYVEEETGQTKHFDGQLFDSVVFDDSVKEFLALKKKLADYFDEKSVEDIFDYIPPQKTNQIFTPKTMVKKMVDMLEQENPGCFDMPDKTFIDLYMKSGLYITEIVKRLYQSDEMKKRFPENKERLKHIFEKQVYGLAPTEIIYKIATSYILGFDEDTKDIKHNFRQLDALPYAKEGTLDQVLDELYPESE